MKNENSLAMVLLVLVLIASLGLLISNGIKYDALLKEYEKLKAQHDYLEWEYTDDITYWKNMYEQALDDLRVAEEELEQYEK